MWRRPLWRVVGPALRTLPPEAAHALVFHTACRLAPACRSARTSAALRAAFPTRGDAALDEASALRLRTQLGRQLLPRHLASEVEVEGEALLEPPVLVVAAHFGQHGLPPVALATRGHAVTVVTVMRDDAELPPAAAYGQARRRDLEASLPVRYVRARPGLVPPAEGVLVMGGDGRAALAIHGEDGRELPLLGRPERWPTRPFAIADRMGIRTVGLFFDSAERRHRLKLVPLGSDDPQAAFAAHYDAWLREHPAQWAFWDERSA